MIKFVNVIKIFCEKHKCEFDHLSTTEIVFVTPSGNNVIAVMFNWSKNSNCDTTMHVSVYSRYKDDCSKRYGLGLNNTLISFDIVQTIMSFKRFLQNCDDIAQSIQKYSDIFRENIKNDIAISANIGLTRMYY